MKLYSPTSTELLRGRGKASGVNSLAYEVTDNKVLFLWFTFSGNTDEAIAYTQLIRNWWKQARTVKCVTMKEKKMKNVAESIDIVAHCATIIKSVSEVDAWIRKRLFL